MSFYRWCLPVVSVAMFATTLCRAQSPAFALDPAKFGFKVTTETSHGHVITDVRDLRSGAVVRTISSVAGEFESMETYSPGGALIERQELVSGVLTRERFVPSYKVIVYSHSKKMRGMREVRVLDYGDGSHGAPHLIFLPELQACRIDAAVFPEDFDFIWGLSFKKTDQLDGPIIDVGGNTILDPNCKPRADKIQTALRNGLTTGLQCLVDHGLSDVAAKVFTLYSDKYPHPVSISCTTPPSTDVDVKYYDKKDKLDHTKTWNMKDAGARGNFACADKFPVIAVNSESFDKMDPQHTAVFFHESLHLAGYSHNEVPDLPYISYFCCFDNFDDPPKSDANKAARKAVNKSACDLMTSAYRKSISKDGCNTPECQNDYMTKFASLMNRDGISNLAFESAWKNIGAPNWNLGQMAAAANGVFDSGGTAKHAFTAYITAAVGNNTEDGRQKYNDALGLPANPTLRKVGDLMADFARARVNLNATGISSDYYENEYAKIRDRLFEAVRDPKIMSCDGMGADQKANLSEAWEIMKDKLKDIGKNAPEPPKGSAAANEPSSDRGKHWGEIKTLWPTLSGNLESIVSNCK